MKTEQLEIEIAAVEHAIINSFSAEPRLVARRAELLGQLKQVLRSFDLDGVVSNTDASRVVTDR
jgi:hypothetical protein